MRNSDKQLVEMYDTLKLSVAEIAEVEGLEEGALRVILMANSPRYRSEHAAVNGENIAKDADFISADNDLALKVIRRVAEYSEDDATALRAAMFIRNDKKGRLNPQKMLGGLNLNVKVLNQHFQQAAEAISRKVLPATTQQITDV